MDKFTIEWDKTGEKQFELGIKRVVLYSVNETGEYDKGFAWNGVTNADENPTGGEPTALYANNRKYAEIDSNEEFGLTIQAFTYPDAFNACLGIKQVEGAEGAYLTQQERATFGIAYRTEIGNDVKGLAAGYKLNLVWGCKAKPSARANQTIGESPDVTPFSWEISTTPVEVAGNKPTAHMVIDSRDVDPEVLKAVEAALYGSGAKAATLPTPDEIIDILKGTGLQG